MNDSLIPVWSYKEEYFDLRDQILGACDRVFQSGVLIRGQEGKAFEQAMAQAHGVAGGVGVNSGTDALVIALAALGVKPGDEVITVPNTAVPTVAAISNLGARPVFVDVNQDFLMDVAKVEAAITSKTKAIVPVHLYGQCVDMDPLMEISHRRGLVVVEDAAQAQGAFYKGRPAGALADAATFSFYPTKVLGAYGDAGLILSNNEDILALARSLRFYGMETTYYSERNGYNSRLDEVQAAILALKLPRVESWVNRRRQIAQRYTTALRDTSIVAPTECSYGQHSYYAYVVEHHDRDGLLNRLAERKVTCNISYRWPIHTMRAYRHLGYEEGDFPITEHKASRILSLPMYPYLTDDQVSYVIDSVVISA